MTDPPALIDTTILGYLFDADVPEKQRISRDLIGPCWRSECRYAVSVQNLAEFSVLVLEKVEHPMPEEDVSRFIRAIVEFEGWTVLNYSGQAVLRAHGIRSRYRLHFWDALLVATMLENGVQRIYSEDRHLARVPEITVVNPYQDRP
jgi:predicted nucleic acid-binding protein